MDGDNSMDVNFTDFKLNQDLFDSAQEMIEERIRHLELVCARSMLRHRQGRNAMGNYPVTNEMMVGVDSKNNGIRKMGDSNLVAKALEMDTEVNKAADKESGSFYDCKICLDMAKEPVLTRCGHLFCWACFYKLANVDSISKECPVCQGEVSEETVIPIYGSTNENVDRVQERGSGGVKIPPRPKGESSLMKI